MKITHHTPQRLSLKGQPWLFWLFGSIFVAVGFVPSLFIGKQELRCDRTPSPGQCELRQDTVWRTSTQTFNLSDVQRADLQSSRDSDGNYTYRAVLVLPQEVIPLTSYYSSGLSNHQASVRQINTFLSSSEQDSLVLRNDDRWFGWLFIFAFSGPGLLIISCSTQVGALEFDKQIGQLSLTRHRLFGKKLIQHPLHTIEDVTVEEHFGSKGSRTYRVAIVLKSGERIPLTPYYSSGLFGKQKVAAQIRNFLGISTPSSPSTPFDHQGRAS
jgi:hypothetical protein